jgi:cytochrome c
MLLSTNLCARGLAFQREAAQQPDQGTTESNLEGRGKELLDARCAHCHAIARTGESPHSAAPPFRTLARKYPIDELAESLAEGRSVGHPDMPEFVFEPDDITAILAYLNSIQEQ